MTMTEQIEKKLLSARKVTPPQDFTSLVMNRVLKNGENRQPESHLFNRLRPTDYPTECSLCFLLAGFYYLIIGVVIMIGFENVLSMGTMGDWIRYQPLITILTALYLIGLGVFSLTRPQSGTKVTTPGILLFLGFVILNALLVRNAAPYPYSLIFLITLSVSGIVMGMLYFIEFIRDEEPFGRHLIIKSNNRGFSLIEVISILIVIAIIAAIIASRGISTSDVTFQSDVDRVKAHLRYAQSASLNSDSTWGIDFTGSKYSLYKWDSVAGAKVKIKIPGEDSTDLSMPEGSSITQPVSFDGWGKPSTDPDADPIANADITLTFNGSSISRSITIYKNTGYVP